ncbi:MAG: OmpA family protein [bacterium]
MSNYIVWIVFTAVFAAFFQASAIAGKMASSISLTVEQALSFDDSRHIWDLFTFVPVVPEGLDCKSWEFAIYDLDGKKVKRIKSDNAIPQSIHWSGTDMTGKLLRDGFYEADLRIWDHRGKVIKSPEERFIFMLPLELENLRVKELIVRNIPPNLVVELPGILFDTGEVSPRSGAEQAVVAVAGLLKAYSENPVQIKGYTDNIGSYKINMVISEQRARMVYEALVSHGISPERLTIRAMANRNPVASNLTERGRLRNRRVEIVIQPA